jgi:hypothetical protein
MPYVPAHQPATELDQRVQAILNNVVNAQGAVGLVFGAIDRNGRILVNEGAGLRSLAKGEKVKLAKAPSQLRPAIDWHSSCIARVYLDDPRQRICSVQHN